MSEPTFQIIEPIINYSKIVSYGILVAWFLGTTYCKKENQKIGSILVLISYFLFYGIKIIATWEISGWISCVVLFFALLIGLWEKEKHRFEYLLFLVITWYCIQNISILIENCFFTIVSDSIIKHFQNLEYFYLQLTIMYFLGVLFGILLAFCMIYLLKKQITSYIQQMRGKEAIYLLLTPTGGVLFGNIIIHVLMVVKGEAYFSLYEEFPQFLGIVPMINLIFYLEILISLSVYNYMMRLQEEQKQNFVEEQKILALKNRIEEVEQFYENARYMKHDMRNHITAIQGLIIKENYTEVQAYLNQMQSSIEELEFSVKTGNAVTDVILNDFRKKAKKQGILFQVEFVFEDSIKIEAFHMGINLSNLLENALEACIRQQSNEEKEKNTEDNGNIYRGYDKQIKNNSTIYETEILKQNIEMDNKDKKQKIQVIGKKKRKFYLLEVKNTFQGDIVWNKKTGLPVSTKTEEKSCHGMGLESVSKVAEKYFGSMDIKIENQMFCVTILLQEK
ncbi:MAG: GHKL domain-containing protein [Lachnospiraceae bacterium]|nr:GHKL domain-containing protein [Lachnospiraceae bacterium]